MKILIADENIEQNRQLCQYISNYDNMIYPLTSNTGLETLEKYNKLKTDILILNSHFGDISSTEIVDRLSSTTSERTKNNILLMANNSQEQCEFLNTVKIYKIFQKPFEYTAIIDTLELLKQELKCKELNDESLETFLYDLKIYGASYETQILISAIKQCYNFPNATNDFNSLLTTLKKQYNEKSEENIRRAMRIALSDLNTYRVKIAESEPVVKQFELDKNITPKVFLEVIASYLRTEKARSMF